MTDERPGRVVRGSLNQPRQLAGRRHVTGDRATAPVEQHRLELLAVGGRDGAEHGARHVRGALEELSEEGPQHLRVRGVGGAVERDGGRVGDPRQENEANGGPLRIRSYR